MRFEMKDLDPLVPHRRLLIFASDGKGFEGENQSLGLRHSGELFGQRYHRALRVAHIAHEAPIGIAVALIGRPGVAAHRERSLARRGDGVDEAAPANERPVQVDGKLARRGVIDRPAAATTQRTPILMSSSATPAAKRARSGIAADVASWASTCAGLRAAR